MVAGTDWAALAVDRIAARARRAKRIGNLLRQSSKPKA
jgi:hypothetical protein